MPKKRKPAVTVTKKGNPAVTVTTSSGGYVLSVNYTFKTLMDSIVWRSYIEPDFFNELFAAFKAIKKRNDQPLGWFLAARGYSGLTRSDFDHLVADLIKSLGHPAVAMKPKDLMGYLHKYTDPKLFINSAWVEW